MACSNTNFDYWRFPSQRDGLDWWQITSVSLYLLLLHCYQNVNNFTHIHGTSNHGRRYDVNVILHLQLLGYTSFADDSFVLWRLLPGYDIQSLDSRLLRRSQQSANWYLRNRLGPPPYSIAGNSLWLMPVYCDDVYCIVWREFFLVSAVRVLE